MSTSLYRHFADDGGLLYVGISLSWPARTKAHVYGSRWFDQVARVEIERFPTREAALEAEREAIRREKPKFNVIHNRGPAVTVRGERRQLRSHGGDPLLQGIAGPDAIVGPALVYRDDVISVMVAHGESGTAGKLTEIVLGKLIPDMPEWAGACDTILTISRPDEITIDQARQTRNEIVRKLKKHLRSVEAFDTDIALAVANATRFPSEKARQILDEVAVERPTPTPGAPA